MDSFFQVLWRWRSHVPRALRRLCSLGGDTRRRRHLRRDLAGRGRTPSPGRCWRPARLGPSAGIATMAEIEHGTLVSWRLSRGKGIGIALTEPVRGKVVVAGFFGRKKGTCRHQTVPRAAGSRRGPGPKDEQLFAYAAKWDDIQAAEASARAARAARKAARVQSQLLEGARKLDAFGFDVEELDKFNRARRAHGVRWDQYIDDLVVMTKPDELLQSVEQYLNATGLELTALIGEDGVVLRRNRGRVAVICATRTGRKSAAISSATVRIGRQCANASSRGSPRYARPTLPRHPPTSRPSYSSRCPPPFLTR